MRKKKSVAGLTVEETRCPKCGGPMFRKPCPCPFKRKGWEACARCFNPACATVVGIRRRPGRSGRKNRIGRPELGPFAIKT